MILPSIALGGSSGWLLKDDDISHLAMATQAKAWNLRQAAIALEHKQLIAMRDLLGRILRLKQSVALDKWRTAVQNALDKKKEDRSQIFVVDSNSVSCGKPTSESTAAATACGSVGCGVERTARSRVRDFMRN